MVEGRKNPGVDEFLKHADQWRGAFEKLRRIALDFALEETLKWGKPCYTLDQRNLVLIHGFKDYCALLFFKGALLPDPHGVLIKQTDNVQAGRQIRFREAAEVDAMALIVKEYVAAAIAVEKSGAVVQRKPAEAFAVPDELQARLNENRLLKTAFEALTPGRQRGYLLFFAGAKQAKTREARIDKMTPRILSGKGLDD